MNRVNFQKETYLIYCIKYDFLLFCITLIANKGFRNILAAEPIAESKNQSSLCDRPKCNSDKNKVICAN